MHALQSGGVERCQPTPGGRRPSLEHVGRHTAACTCSGGCALACLRCVPCSQGQSITGKSRNITSPHQSVQQKLQYHFAGLLPHASYRSFGQPAILINILPTGCRWPARYLQLLSCHRRHQLCRPVLFLLLSTSSWPLASAPAAKRRALGMHHVCLRLFYTRQPVPALKRAAGNCAAPALQGKTGIKQCIN